MSGSGIHQWLYLKVYLHNSTVSYAAEQLEYNQEMESKLSHTSSFQHLPRSLGAIRQGQGNNLIVSREFDLAQTSAYNPSSYNDRSPPTHILEND